MTGETDRPLGDSEIAVEILELRVAELEQAIRRLADQDATLSVCDGAVTVTMDGSLTSEEREAVDYVCRNVLPDGSREGDDALNLLRMLLKRTQ